MMNKKERDKFLRKNSTVRLISDDVKRYKSNRTININTSSNSRTTYPPRRRHS